LDPASHSRSCKKSAACIGKTLGLKFKDFRDFLISTVRSWKMRKGFSGKKRVKYDSCGSVGGGYPPKIPEASPLAAPVEDRHLTRFREVLASPVIDIEKLRELSWSGIPDHFRAQVWRLLLDYEPVNSRIREESLSHKRSDYFDCLNRVYGESQRHMWTNVQKQTQLQIRRDLPRTGYHLLRCQRAQDLFERVLFVWSVRHPASGYVQGMNDVLSPFFFVFIEPLIDKDILSEVSSVSELKSVDCVSEEQWRILEPDCFWCFSKLLDGIQDFYTKDQPGLYRMLDQLSVIMHKVDPEMANWIDSEEIAYAEFAFRWINCLLVRELSLSVVFRLWDMYLSEHTRIASTHVYVCAALLNFLSSRFSLLEKSHSDFVVVVQSIDHSSLNIEDMGMILAQAYVYEQMCREQKSFAIRSTSTPSFRKLS
jgi:hypothetical protein